MRYYSEDHVWVSLEAGLATLGISRHAAAELGELTFVEVPPRGTHLHAGDVVCVVESVKTAADVAAPVAGVVQEANAALADHPALVNASPEGEGWICRLANVPDADFQRLMTPAQYDAFLAAQADA
jgi:glycine cleavage system H protein